MAYTNPAHVTFKGEELAAKIDAYMREHPTVTYGEAMKIVALDASNRQALEKYNARDGSTVVRNSQDGFEAAEVFTATLKTGKPNRGSLKTNTRPTTHRHKRISLRSESENARNKVDRTMANYLLAAMAKEMQRKVHIGFEEALTLVVNLPEVRGLALAAAVDSDRPRVA